MCYPCSVKTCSWDPPLFPAWGEILCKCVKWKSSLTCVDDDNGRVVYKPGDNVDDGRWSQRGAVVPISSFTVDSWVFFVDQRFTCYDQIITNGSTSVAHSSLEQGVKITIKPNYTHKNFYIQTFQSEQVVFEKLQNIFFKKGLASFKLPSSKLGLYYFILLYWRTIDEPYNQYD